jgi:hypothetical protein
MVIARGLAGREQRQPLEEVLETQQRSNTLVEGEFVEDQTRDRADRGKPRRLADSGAIRRE